MALKNSRAGKIQFNLIACAAGGFAITGAALATFTNFAPQGQQPASRKSTEAPVPPRGKFGQDLFIAIDHRDTKAVEDLLKQGADPNSRNGLEFVPLYIAAASHQPDVVTALLKAGAKPDATSTYGTPLMFACATGNVPDAERFLGLGANPGYQRTDGFTPLMEATNCGCTPLVAELIAHKVDVNVQDDAGSSALSLAARNGSMDVAKTLLAAGAKTDLIDEEGMTPLMAAAINGHADIVKLLLDSGANPNAVDGRKRSALILAASYGDYPDVVKTLLDGKADPSAKDAKGRTAAQIAAEKGYAQAAALLGASSSTAPTRSPQDAVNLSLKMIQSSTKLFAEGATCVSCHQEGLGRMVTGLAAGNGIKLDADIQKTEQARILGMVMGLRPLHEQALKNPEVMKQLPLVEMNEVTTTYTWVLAGLADQNQPASDATGVMAMCLARQQAKDGCWTFSLPRVPMQSSFFTFSALAVKDLNAYGPKAYSKEVAQRIANARQWFLVAKPQNSEDRAFRLLGLKWSGADAAACKQAAADIIADQRPDGGWSQLPNLPSDAYATGQALYALRLGAGTSTKDPAYVKGTQFLLRTQDDDGSWFVSKRAIQANNYFDAGFPHGESQYSSFNGTCWATMALLPTVGSKKG